MFFGTISPSSTCSTTTIVIAMTNDTVCSTVSGMPSRWNGFSNRCATAGSPTRPNRIEQIGDAQLRPGQHHRQILVPPG